MDGDASAFKLVTVKRILKDRTRMRTSKDAVVATAAMLEYLTTEILDGARTVADGEGKKKIATKHLSAAISRDEELSQLGQRWLIKGAAQHPQEVDGSAEEAGSSENGGRKHKKVSVANHGGAFRSAIKRVARQMRPDGAMQISNTSIQTLNGVAASICEDIGVLASELAHKVGKQTIGADDVTSAVEQMLKGELRTHTIREVKEALAKSQEVTTRN